MILGFDIGGTKTAVVLGTREGKIIQRREMRTEPGRGFHAVFDEMCRLGEDLRITHGHGVDAVSVSVGGPLDVGRGIILSPPNLPGWDAIPLKELLATRFLLPVYIEHDGNAGALAEWKFGAAQGKRNVIFLTMGTGFGGGFILDGRLYRGTTDMAGEVGHLRIADDGPPCYGKSGSLEGYASGTGIALLAHRMFPGHWPQMLSVRELADEHRAGSAEAKAVFTMAAKRFGRGLALLIDTLNPECIVLGGLGMRLQDVFVEPALRTAKEESLPRAWEACQIVPAQLGESIGDLAALCAAIDQAPHQEQHT
ncbi:MAG: ROK family protein [Ignavibacteriae bacterium]|nr:ROK family protein [Ignavibacteriota bacterium]